jgi:hypothetical protein
MIGLGMAMAGFRVDALLRRKVISSTSVEASSHVHAVVKTMARQLMPGSTPGKPWIKVTKVATRKAEVSIRERRTMVAPLATPADNFSSIYGLVMPKMSRRVCRNTAQQHSKTFSPA